MANNITKNKQGQGLLELVVAIGVISVGLFSVWGLFISNFNGEQEANARILAINLAREGVEVVKNMRDSNWLHIEDNQDCSYNGELLSPCYFDSGLVGDGTGVIKNIFSEDVYIEYSEVNDISDEGARLYTDPITTLYSHNTDGISTQYRRIIKIKNICCNANENLICDNTPFEVQNSSCLSPKLKVGINVESLVRWVLQGKNRELSINHRIFNWK